MDGWLTIGTKIDDNGFDKDVSLLNDKLSIVENEQKKINQTTGEYKKELISVETNMNQIIGEMNQLESKAIALESSGQKYSTSYNNVVNKMDNLNDKYGELEKRQQSLNSNINDQNIKYDKLNIKANSYKNSLEKLNLKKQTAEISNANTKMNLLTNSVTKTGNGVQNTINKISKMALSIFGAATAYRIMSSAASTLSQYNKGISANIEYMKFALATALQPVIEGIINLAHKLLAYIAYIAKAWFGISLFANASSKSFQNAQKSTSKMKKDTKEMHKSLASGIDEITNLDKLDNDNKNNDENSGIQVPTFDLGNLDDVPIPGWIKWIAENKDLVIGALIGIAGAIAIFKLAGFIKDLFDVAKGVGKIVGKFGLLKSLGIAVIIGGIAMTIKGVIDFIKDPCWDNFKTILKGISAILFGVAMVVGGPLSITIAAIAAAVLGITMIIDGVINYLKDPTWENFKTILGGIALIVLAIALIFGSIPALIVAIIAIVAAVGLVIYKHWDEIKETVSIVWENIKTKVSEVVETVKQKIGEWIENLKQKFEELKNNVSTIFTNIKNTAVNIWNNITTSISSIVTNIKNHISNTLNNIKTIWNSIFNSIKTTTSNIFNGIWSTIKRIINSILGGIEGMANGIVRGVNTVINAMNGLSFDIPEWVPGMGGNKFGFNIPNLNNISLPRLATGAVIPPRQEFMAVLGDQRNGRNLEAPENLIRQIVREESGNKKVTIITKLVVDKRELAEIIKEVNLDEEITSPDLDGGGAFVY